MGRKEVGEGVMFRGPPFTALTSVPNAQCLGGWLS